MKKYFVLFWLLLSILPFSQAQQHQYSWKIGVHGGFATYYGDLSHRFFDVHHKMKAPFQNLDFWAYGLSLEYHVSKTFGIRLMGFKSQIVSNDRTYSDNGNFNRALNVQTDLIDVSLLGVIYLDNGRIFGHKAVISPYFLIGGGLTYFDAKADLLDADGNRYYYWSDRTIRNLDQADPNANLAVVIDLDNKYETALSPLKTEGYQYLPVTWHVAAGLGFKFRLSKRFHLHLEAVLRYTGTDYLDDVSGEYLPYYTDNFQGYAANPSNDSRSTRGSTPDMNDWTAYIALSLHYSFGQKTYDMRPSIIYTPSLLVMDTVGADTVLVVNENNADATTNVYLHDSSHFTNSTIALIADTTNLKDSLSIAKADSTQKKDTIAGQQVDSIAIVKNSVYNKNISNEVHELQIGNLEMEYEYQLKLLKQEYEYELKIQELGHQLELEKLKKSQPQESYEKDLQKLKYEQDLKLQKQDYEHQLKLKELQHALELEKVQNKKTSFRDSSTNNVTHWVTTEEHHTHYDNNNNSTKNNSTANNANTLPLQQHLDKLLLAMEQQQKQLDVLLNLERNTGSKNENNSSNTSNATTTSNTSTNTKELEDAKSQNNILQAQIEVLEQALKQNISKDSTNSRVSNIEKDLSAQLHQVSAENKNLATQLAKANLQNNQQKELIDSLLMKVNELESTKKNISNELGKFLNKESSTHITKIYFAVNKTNLTIQAEETLTTLAQHLKNYPEVRYWVKGFASRKGDAVRNEQLSKDRAVVVAEYLEQLGIQKDRLKITSLGSSQSILDNDVDRRAEVHLYFE